MLKTCAVLFAAALFSMCWAGAAQAEGGETAAPSDSAPALVSAAEPLRLARLMREAGFDAIYEAGDNGQGRIASRHASSRFWIQFVRCESGPPSCKVLQFYTGYRRSDPALMKTMNAWNLAEYGKAYLNSENQPRLSWEVNTEGGITEEVFIDSLRWFTGLMGKFETVIGWDRRHDPVRVPLPIEEGSRSI